MALPVSALVALALALTAPTRAGAEPTSREQQARDLAVEGEQAWQRKDYAAAADAYRRAYDLLPEPRLRYNLGIALAELGRDPDAVNELDAFLREATGAPAASRDHAAKLIAARDKRLGRLDVSTGLSEPVDVTVDGAAIGRAPVRWRVWPGPHQITASARGRRPSSTKVTIGAGEVLRVTLDPTAADLTVRPRETGALALDSPRRDEPARERSILKRWWFWTIVGSVAVAASATIYFAARDPGCPDDSDTSLGGVCPFSP